MREGFYNEFKIECAYILLFYDGTSFLSYAVMVLKSTLGGVQGWIGL